MPRLSAIDDILFPVEEHPVQVTIPDGDSGRTLGVPRKKAIVNMLSNRVLGIVGANYRLVMNREALDWARDCCRAVFPETKEIEWGVDAIDAPGTAGYCTIDLRHNSTALDFSFLPPGLRPEAYGPFIRVTNSYNGMRALAFDIGFYRKVCKNGLIMPDSIIHFKFAHQRGALAGGLDGKIEFTVARERLKKSGVVLNDCLAALVKCPVRRADCVPLLQRVLLLKKPEPLAAGRGQESDWEDLQKELVGLSSRYCEELGDNAYAAFNAVTDFASRPPENRLVHRDRHSLQRRVGVWLTEFSQLCQKTDFDLRTYLDSVEKETTPRYPKAEMQNSAS